MRKCFFITPIGDENSISRKRSDKVLNHLLVPVCNELELEVIRVDKISKTSSITDDIFEHLKNDDVIIADITDHNPNVFLELGYRIALEKPYIIIQDIEYTQSYPFDISNIRIMNYDLDIDNISNSKNQLSDFIKNIHFENSSVHKITDHLYTTDTKDENENPFVVFTVKE